jgi:hypothetical protein
LKDVNKSSPFSRFGDVLEAEGGGVFDVPGDDAPESALVYIFVYVYLCLYVYVYVYIYGGVYLYMYIYIYIYIYIHICIYIYPGSRCSRY